MSVKHLPDRLYCYDFPYWKRSVMRQCFPAREIIFIDKPANLPEGSGLVLWGMKNVPSGFSSVAPVFRMEDGFLRSVGLGADLVRPLSWVVDRRGIYYDATKPSDLETILTETQFDGSLCRRAAVLRKKINASGITKYNAGARRWSRPLEVKQVILVPGQVESDASIAYGAADVRRNMDLLRTVRKKNPQAYIVYKPHPDVFARLRREGVGEQEAHRWCDEIVTDVAMGDLLQQVDEVHVLTSLAGFEALLRHKPVTCYGHPFYAGWGLTTDINPPLRRERKLTLDELVAGALIKYPLYMSRDGKNLIGPEQALDELISWHKTSGGTDGAWRKFKRIFLRLFVAELSFS